MYAITHAVDTDVVIPITLQMYASVSGALLDSAVLFITIRATPAQARILVPSNLTLIADRLISARDLIHISTAGSTYESTHTFRLSMLLSLDGYVTYNASVPGLSYEPAYEAVSGHVWSMCMLRGYADGN